MTDLQENIMTNAEVVAALKKLRACRESIEWASEHGGDWSALWRDCQRGDWMLWLAGMLAGEPGSDKRRPLVLATCECARLALKHVPDGEDRPRKAIEAAEAWAHGAAGVTLEQVRAYADAAAYAYAYAYAAYAYAAAADAAAAAAAAADDAAAAAAYAAYAADAYAAARGTRLAQCADIVRKHYPTAPELAHD
jgi:hypothetical protein